MSKYLRTLTSIVLVVGSLTSAYAFAQTDNSGFAVTAEIARSEIKDVDGPGDEFDGNDIGWNLDLEWRFNQHIAIGAQYTDFGEDTDFFNSEDSTISVDGFGFYVRGYVPVNDKITLNATLGHFLYDADIDPGTSDFTIFGEDAVMYGVGADYALDTNWSIRVQYRHFDGEDDEEASLMSIGARYQF